MAKRKILPILIIILCFSNNLLSQNRRIRGSQYFNNITMKIGQGQVTFSTELKYAISQGGFIDLAFFNFVVSKYVVNGNDASNYGYTFPMKVECPQFRVTAKIPFTDGLKTTTIDEIFPQVEEKSDFYNIDEVNREKIWNFFDFKQGDLDKFYSLQVNTLGATISEPTIIEELEEIRRGMNAKIREEEEAARLKEEEEAARLKEEEEAARLKEEEEAARLKEEEVKSLNEDKDQETKSNEQQDDLNTDNSQEGAMKKDETDRVSSSENSENKENSIKEEQERLAREQKEQFQRRQEAAIQENEMIASTAAAQTALLLYFGEIIYGNYGYIPKGMIYTENSLRFSLEGGYGISGSPIYFNSDDFDYGEELRYDYNVTLDLNFRLNLLGYERTLFKNYAVGTQPYVGLSAGMFPHGNTKARLDLGGKIFGGLKNIKLEGGYEYGIRNLNNYSWFSLNDMGSGKSVYSHNLSSYGVRFSFWDWKKIARHHISFGLLKEQIIVNDNPFNGEATVVQERTQDRDIFESSSTDLSYQDFLNKLRYDGLYLEWQHDHHGRLFIRYFNNYPYTGVKTTSGSPESSQEYGYPYFSIGFSRLFGGYVDLSKNNYKLKSNESSNDRSKLKRNKRDDIHFFGITYDKHSVFGITNGSLNKGKIGYYWHLKSFSWTLEKNYDAIEKEPYRGAMRINNAGESFEHDDDPNYSHFRRTNNTIEISDAAISGGITFSSPKYPFSTYVGLGLNFFRQFDEVKQYETRTYDPFNPTDEYELKFYKNVDESGLKLFPEIGLAYKAFDAIVLKYGLSYQRGVYSQFGIGFVIGEDMF